MFDPNDASKYHDKKPDPILLTLFANRFMSVAEAMGRSLQQTSISTNIKERLDFSCALFAPDGDLVANAPFIPIHLGSMSFAVKYQMKLHANDLKEGDVLMVNSPYAGGSHLPDITIITPVFDPKSKHIIFFTASRGHHADIGGILPGSMPPTSVTLFEEGAEIVSFKIVDAGVYDRKGLIEYMVDKPSHYPGSSGCRNFRDVESDLKAPHVHSVVEDYGLETVQEYMYHIRTNAEISVRKLLRDVAQRAGTNVLSAVDYLDDGSPICLKVEINEDSGSAVLDFAGTGYTPKCGLFGSTRKYGHHGFAPSPILIILFPVKIPPKSLLSPSRTAAVCGGNVLTSQRIVDVVLKAFHAVAASQGCTNNLTFGTGGKDKDGKVVAGWGYYETIAGGSGAGPNWHGTDGVHTHITNTRIGDVEILERRYPVMIHRFGLRPQSGGVGQWRGGDGVVREIEVLEPMQVSILSERRTRQPYGMEGGAPGAMGKNTWIKKLREEDGDYDEQNFSGTREINIGGKATVWMGKGDKLLIETPGGGAWGISDVAAGMERGTVSHVNTWEP
ncbi:hypothetical protein AMATHDRAFT_49403 [Amanita thiersii Skay4041]|uniref:Hydantoinase B/oxoprolinase domain-containing protein n=1 Tax=Amanita thiersii Skay4041 TaxID=703135 RepID=A0A2A9NEU5_9AGAR|nr:hypothetical protein AMATHDRAFT_49403 [Amanita thiersii Skay4041]